MSAGEGQASGRASSRLARHQRQACSDRRILRSPRRVAMVRPERGRRAALPLSRLETVTLGRLIDFAETQVPNLVVVAISTSAQQTSARQAPRSCVTLARTRLVASRARAISFWVSGGRRRTASSACSRSLVMRATILFHACRRKWFEEAADLNQAGAPPGLG
jgi:hypothetical protein